MNKDLQTLTEFFENNSFMIEVYERESEEKGKYVEIDGGKLLIDWFKECDKEKRIVDFPVPTQMEPIFDLFCCIDYQNENAFRDNVTNETYNALIGFLVEILEDNNETYEVRVLLGYAYERIEKLSALNAEKLKGLVIDCFDDLGNMEVFECDILELLTKIATNGK